MRVLVVPEFYRQDDASANGTVSDAVAWIREWLDRDPTMHVYVLARRASPRGTSRRTSSGTADA